MLKISDIPDAAVVNVNIPRIFGSINLVEYMCQTKKSLKKKSQQNSMK